MIKPINAIYAQSGGVTPVINATACGVIETVQTIKSNSPAIMGKIYGGINGILGILQEELIDLTLEDCSKINGLKFTPGGALGSCRYKLKSLQDNPTEYSRLIEVFKAHNIGYFFYNGGGDSQDTANKISQIGAKLGYPLTCIGIPKTIDNDLMFTDNSPGFGSVAKYVAISTLEASLDVIAMAKNSTKVFILEVMGRNAGWIAAASALASKNDAGPPHLILFPEVPLNLEKFYAKIIETISNYGYCVIVTSEGIKLNRDQQLNSPQDVATTADQFGHVQLGGVAGYLANLIKTQLKLKTHWAIADYLQRSARHIASQVDLDQAYALGKSAVELALAGYNAVMPIIVRIKNNPYCWNISSVSLNEVANEEKKLPSNFIREDGFHITPKCREYLLPLIQGEAYPPYHNGIPQYTVLEKHYIKKKLSPFEINH